MENLLTACTVRSCTRHSWPRFTIQGHLQISRAREIHIFKRASSHVTPPGWKDAHSAVPVSLIHDKRFRKTRHTIFGVTRWRSPNLELARFWSFTPNIYKRRFHVGWFILRSVNSHIHTIKWTSAYDGRRLQVVSNKSIRDTYRPIDTTPCPPEHYQRMSARP